MDYSPEKQCVLICDGHRSHICYKFLNLCIQHSGCVILILQPQHMSHVTQGKDLINFFNNKSLARKKTLLASIKKYRLLWPTDQLAWGGTKARRAAQLGNTYLMFCIWDT